jgi:hypothetical protein
MQNKIGKKAEVKEEICKPTLTGSFAKIQQHTILETLRRMESKDPELITSNEKRASVYDNCSIGSPFLGNYLEKLTNKVKPYIELRLSPTNMQAASPVT